MSQPFWLTFKVALFHFLGLLVILGDFNLSYGKCKGFEHKAAQLCICAVVQLVHKQLFDPCRNIGNNKVIIVFF